MTILKNKGHRYLLRHADTGRPMYFIEADSPEQAIERAKRVHRHTGDNNSASFTAAESDAQMFLPSFLDAYFVMLDR